MRSCPAILFCHSAPGLIAYWWSNRTRSNWLQGCLIRPRYPLTRPPRAAASRSLAAFAANPAKRTQRSCRDGRRQTDVNRNARVGESRLPVCHSEDAVASDFIKGPVFVCRLSARWISCTLDCQPVVFSVAHKEFFDLFVCGGREMIKLCLSGFNGSSATERDGDCRWGPRWR